jgi:pimeloyl-ACP methyl ester carboxylesterase
MERIVDDTERQLDELGLAKVHLAGNSMGGWVAIELARRGRVLTVCALSPAGTWEVDWKDKQRVFDLLSAAVREIRHSRAKLPELAQSGDWRRQALRHGALHGERVSQSEFFARPSTRTLGTHCGSGSASSLPRCRSRIPQITNVSIWIGTSSAIAARGERRRAAR